MRRYLLLLSFLVSTSILACGVFFSNEFVNNPFTLSREDSLIIFDKETGDQQFIRKITVSGPQKEFGFLVPIPTMPVVDEVSDDILAWMDEEYEAQRPVETLLDWYPLDLIFTFLGDDMAGGLIGSANDGFGGAPGGAISRSQVEVISQQQIGGFEVSVLKATEAQALQSWIDTNAYKVPDESRDYLDLYVKREFYFVVFNFKPAGELSNQPTIRDSHFIRIRYNYEEPFYPFREAISAVDKLGSTDDDSSTDRAMKPGLREEIYSAKRDFRLSLLTRGPVYYKLAEERSFDPQNRSLEDELRQFWSSNFHVRFQNEIQHTKEKWEKFGVEQGEGEKWVLSQYQFLHSMRPQSDLLFKPYAKAAEFEPTLPPARVNVIQAGVWASIALFVFLLAAIRYVYVALRKKRDRR